MSDAVYPVLPGLTWPVKRTPIFSTKISTTPSGREFAQARMTYPRYRYGLTYEFLRSEAAYLQFQTLFGFYGQRLGMYDSFLFRDEDDRAVTAQGFGTGDGTTVAFQLVRALGGHTVPVWAVDSSAGAPTIFVAGVPKTAGADYTLSATGLVTFTTAPAAAAALTWTGAYYWRCRFEMDEMPLDQFMRHFWKTGEVRFITRKP
jgi:uncharacterized protein (TIGR02217 family)